MLKKQRALYGNAYNFTPLTFTLPNDYSKFLDVFMKRQMDPSGLGHHANNNDFYAIKDDQLAQSTIYAQTMANGFKQNMKELWICKPTDMSRGRNIFLVDDISQLHNF